MIDERLAEYIKYTKTFEQNDQDLIKRKFKLLYIVIGAVSVIAVSQSIALAIMTPLKKEIPVIFRVDNAKGTIQQVALANVEQFNIDKNEALDKANAAKYLINRESYDYYNLQLNYDTTLLMSADDIAKDYINLYSSSNKNNLYDKYGKETRVSIDIKNVSFYEKSAIVRFNRTIKTNNNIIASTQEMATIAYKYVSGQMTDSDRLLNPLGYRVVGYRIDKDINNSGVQ